VQVLWAEGMEAEEVVRRLQQVVRDKRKVAMAARVTQEVRPRDLARLLEAFLCYRWYSASAGSDRLYRPAYSPVAQISNAILETRRGRMEKYITTENLTTPKLLISAAPQKKLNRLQQAQDMRDAGQLTKEEHQRSLPLVLLSNFDLARLDDCLSCGSQKSKSRRNCLNCFAYLRDRTVGPYKFLRLVPA
jgi:hypothetical protein